MPRRKVGDRLHVEVPQNVARLCRMLAESHASAAVWVVVGDSPPQAKGQKALSRMVHNRFFVSRTSTYRVEVGVRWLQAAQQGFAELQLPPIGKKQKRQVLQQKHERRVTAMAADALYTEF